METQAVAFTATDLGCRCHLVNTPAVLRDTRERAFGTQELGKARNRFGHCGREFRQQYQTAEQLKVGDLQYEVQLYAHHMGRGAGVPRAIHKFYMPLLLFGGTSRHINTDRS